MKSPFTEVHRESILSGHGAEQRSMERNYQSPARFRHAAVVVLPPRSISPDPSDYPLNIFSSHLLVSLFPSSSNSRFLVSVPLRFASMHVRALTLPLYCYASMYVHIYACIYTVQHALKRSALIINLLR